MQKLLLLFLLPLDFFFCHVLNSFGQGFNKVLELDEVRSKVDAAVLAFSLLSLAPAASHTKHGKQVNVVLAQLWDLAPDDLLELLTSYHLACVLLILASESDVNLSL